MTNRELSNEIRKTLKEAGFTSKDYSIRVRDAGYSTTVNIEVKNPKVKLSELKQFVKRFEVVDRDERTGEILQGGNTFVHCQYEDGIFEEVIQPLMEIAKQVYTSSKWDGCKIAENESFNVFMSKIDEATKSLHMYDRDGRLQEGKCILKTPESLALAMWRFKNIGTIFA